MNIRLVTLSVLAVAIILPLKAQHLPAGVFADDKTVERFYNGCIKIIEAELATDSLARDEAYSHAMDLLNPRRKGLETGQMNLITTDSTGIADSTPSDFAFDYSYARAKHRHTDFAPSGISRGFGNACRLYDLTLKPFGKAVFKEIVHDECMLIAVARPGGAIATDISAGDKGIKVETFENGLVNFASWTLDGRSEVTYTIKNLSDREATIILISN